MVGSAVASSTDIYEAVVALARFIAGRTDLTSLLAGVAESLGRIVTFDHVGVILHDPVGNSMQGHILNAPGNPVLTSLRLPVDEDPAAWVWQNQQGLVISIQSESRWPTFIKRAREEFGISTTILVPLTSGTASALASVGRAIQPQSGRLCF
jgi:transcriptional regulator with GAF, ATPase, and Fis domain